MKTLFFCLFAIMAGALNAQKLSLQVLDVANIHKLHNGGTCIQWTLGDMVTSSFEPTGGPKLFEGHLQPLDFICTYTTDVGAAVEPSVEIIFPNPFSTEFQIELGGPAEQPLFGNLYNQLGQSVRLFTMLSGDSNLTIETDDLPPGFYYLSILGGGGTQLRGYPLVKR